MGPKQEQKKNFLISKHKKEGKNFFTLEGPCVGHLIVIIINLTQNTLQKYYFLETYCMYINFNMID